MAVTFPRLEVWDGERLAVSFPAELDGQRIQCRISMEALQDNFDNLGALPLEIFTTRRGEIEQIAAELLDQQRFEPDGTILIRSQDF